MMTRTFGKKVLFSAPQALVLAALITACGSKEAGTQNQEQAAPSAPVEASAAVIEPGVYRLAGDKLAIDLAQHPDIAKKVAPYFTEQSELVANSILIIEPSQSDKEEKLGVGSVRVDGPVRVDAAPRTVPDVVIPSSRIDSLSPTRSLSPDSLTPGLSGMRRSPGFADLQRLDYIDSIMFPKRDTSAPAPRVGDLHRSPGSRSLASLGDNIADRYKAIFHPESAQVNLSLLPMSSN